MSEIMFSHQKRVKKAFFYTTSPQGVLFCQNKSQLSNLQNGHREMLFLTPHFWPFKNHWTCQKSCFPIRRGLKSIFFYLTSPQGVLFCQIRVSCQTFKMVIQRCFFVNASFLTIWKPLDMSEIMFSHQKRVKKAFFLSDLPKGGLVLPKIRVSCQTFKMDIERCFFLPPIFDHLKTTGHVRNHVFPSEEG